MKILTTPQSGSVAGQTSSRSRFGQYIRTRAMVTNPNTEAQVAARANLSNASSFWRMLSESVRAAWNAFAASMPRVDSLGQTIYLTGFQQYVGVSAFLQSLGLPPVSVPPTAPTDSLVTTFDAGASLAAIDITGSATASIAIFASPPQSPGVSFCNDYRFMASATLVAGAMTADVQAEWSAKFGVPVVGQKVFVKGIPYSADGSRGAAVVSSTILS